LQIFFLILKNLGMSWDILTPPCNHSASNNKIGREYNSGFFLLSSCVFGLVLLLGEQHHPVPSLLKLLYTLGQLLNVTSGLKIFLIRKLILQQSGRPESSGEVNAELQNSRSLLSAAVAVPEGCASHRWAVGIRRSVGLGDAAVGPCALGGQGSVTRRRSRQALAACPKRGGSLTECIWRTVAGSGYSQKAEGDR